MPCWARPLSAPDVKVVNRQISAWSRAHEWRQALRLLASSLQGFILPDIVTFGATVNACERGRCWRRTVDLLQKLRVHRLQPDLITWNSAVCAADKACRWQAALALLFCLSLWNLCPDKVGVSAGASACREGAWAWSLRLLEGFLQSAGAAADPATFNAVAAACEAERHWEQPLQLISSAREVSLRPDVVGISCAAGACSSSLCWDRALLLLMQMQKLEGSLNTISFSTGITAANYHWPLALALLSDAKHARVRKDSIMQHAVLSACEKGSHWLLALHELSQLRNAGTVAHNAALGACAAQDCWCWVLELLCDLDSQARVPSEVTSRVALGALVASRQWQRAVLTAAVLHSARAEPNAATRGAVVSACEVGFWAAGLPRALTDLERVVQW
eukprot:TRINITY_DN19777_c1_g1_i1.p1 TRINITY_DN19777_c1_g1~~TRINITY_DN19777_c1_g1_i1.p1  ORF type:complete len:390 (-),score=84.98 TRINITY_DN19777_c1_g1_i1:5-1174(-)